MDGNWKTTRYFYTKCVIIHHNIIQKITEIVCVPYYEAYNNLFTLGEKLQQKSYIPVTHPSIEKPETQVG
jgi:hypothetical protein